MRANDLAILNAARRARKAVVTLTALSGTQSQVFIEGDVLAGDLDEMIVPALRSGRSGLVVRDGQNYFLNVYLPPPRIVVIGAVHISQALAGLAAIAGFDLTIIDPRTAFATPERFAGVELLAEWPEDVLQTRPLDPYTALVAVTHDPKIDDYPLMAALACGCFYVGALGSRKTHAKRVERFKAARLSDDAIASISAPIGLDIAAANPAEIAVAILADVIRAFRTRDVEKLPAGTP